MASELRPGLLGARVERVEDNRHLHGRGAFVGDISIPGILDVAFVRSPLAHARIRKVGPPDGARDRFWAAADLSDLQAMRVESSLPGYAAHSQPVIAATSVRYVGEILAAVLADSRYEAEDLADNVQVELDPLPAVTGIEDALRAGAPLVLPEVKGNVFLRRNVSVGDLEATRARAILVLNETFASARYTGVPLETRGVLAQYDTDRELLTVWNSTQIPHLLRTGLSLSLGIPERRIRVVAPDVGGGFGIKCNLYPEDVLVAAIAIRSGRPIRWLEDRREHLMTALHAREHEYEIEAHFAADGELLGLHNRVAVNCGAYGPWPWGAAMEANMAAGITPGPYRVKVYHAEAVSVATHTCPLGPYRGVGRPGACFAIERTMDEAAHRLGISPVEIRLRNLVRSDEFPYRAVNGLVYDSGSYQEALELAAEKVGFTNREPRQKAARERGRMFGVGFANYTEQTAHGTSEWVRRGVPIIPGYESIDMSMDPTGEVTAAVGVTSHGQGHETTLAQVAAEVLGIDYRQVRIRQGDTDNTPYGMGTFASRSAVLAGAAVHRAATDLRGRLLALAAKELETAVEDLEIRDGKVTVRGQDSPRISVAALAAIAHFRPERLPDGQEPGLHAVHYVELEPGNGTFSNACHAAVVEVDPQTGQVELLDYVVVEDCGRMINPMIVEGQVHGGVAQGIGGALLEELVYGPDGQLLTTTLMDYLLPGTPDVPNIRVTHLESPAPDTPMGVKGMGEGGAIAPPAAIANAVADALRPLGVAIRSTPLKPSTVWEAIQAAKGPSVPQPPASQTVA